MSLCHDNASPDEPLAWQCMMSCWLWTLPWPLLWKQQLKEQGFVHRYERIFAIWERKHKGFLYKYIIFHKMCTWCYSLHWDVYIILISRLTWFINSSSPGQNGRHFADDIFKCIFFNVKIRIVIKIPLEFVPEGSIENDPALVQIMAWRQIGDKPLSELMLTWLTDAYMRH